MTKSPWDEYLAEAQARWETIKQQESYKSDLAEALEKARNALLRDEPNWAELVTEAVMHKRNNIIDWRENKAKFEKCVSNYPDAMRDALDKMWSEDDRTPGDRIRAFDSRISENMLGISQKAVGTRLTITSYLIMGLDILRYPPYQVSRFDKTYEYLDYPQPSADDAGSQYEHALGFLDRIIEEAKKRGMNVPKSRLDAQSIVFDLNKWVPEKLKPRPNGLPKRNQKMSHPLNTILYGPPGTGKTWHTVTRAVAIIEEKDVSEVEKEKRDEVKRRFEIYRDRNRDDGQIEMVTFHQNTTYEDFIEGIRPVLNNDQASANGQATGEPQRSVSAAAGVLTDINDDEQSSSEDDKPGEVQYEMREGVFRRIAKRAEAKRDQQRYVLVIDEINRGNIARIFGELITLIEDSKRTDADDEAWVTLPGSQDTFSVPPNLYLLGTMNTADRSIALLDTALRRRFKFIEMMPNPSHEGVNKNVDGVDCSRLLKAMNNRIAVLLDREHQIGHTYFLKVNTLQKLAEAFQHGVLPLLQEYFYEDWEKISAALNNNGFVKRDAAPEELLKSGLADEKQAIYNLLPHDDKRWTAPAAYQAIYKTTTGETEEPNGERATEALDDNAAEADADSAAGDE